MTASVSGTVDPSGLQKSTSKLAATLTGMTDTGASTFMNCTVNSVVTGGAPDGTDLVKINVGTDVVTAPYLNASPPAGSTVRVEFCNGSPIIHGRVLGKTA